MTTNLQQRAQRLLALGVLAATLLTAWLCVAQPILDYVNAAVEARSLSLRALRRNRALLHGRAAIETARTTVAQSPRWRNFYAGPNAEAATLQMETDLRAILRDSNNPTSMVAETPSVRGSVTQIAVRITLAVSIDQLAAALDRIQKHPRQLRIEALTIQAPQIQTAQTNPTLTAQAQVTAMMAAGSPGKP
jgi:hypothetical protein